MVSGRCLHVWLVTWVRGWSSGFRMHNVGFGFLDGATFQIQECRTQPEHSAEGKGSKPVLHSGCNDVNHRPYTLKPKAYTLTLNPEALNLLNP